MHQIEHYELADQHAVGLTLRAGCRLRVSQGRLWLTQPGQAQDVWLHAGECWTQPSSGTVWLSAEPVAEFQLVRALQPWPASLRRPSPTAWPWPLPAGVAEKMRRYLHPAKPLGI